LLTEAREALKHWLRSAIAEGLAPDAYVRVTQLVFGPYTPFPVEFRIVGPDPAQLYEVFEKALEIMQGVPNFRQANRDWGNRAPVLRFVPGQDRLNLIGLSTPKPRSSYNSCSSAFRSRKFARISATCPSWRAALATIVSIRHGWRTSRDGRPIPLDQIGHSSSQI
jgi:hypothetical protein